jgi:hypothetical protein
MADDKGKKKDDGKRVKFVIEGSLPIEGDDVDGAMATLRELVSHVRMRATVEVEYALPRLTKLAL